MGMVVVVGLGFVFLVIPISSEDGSFMVSVRVASKVLPLSNQAYAKWRAETQEGLLEPVDGTGKHSTFT